MSYKTAHEMHNLQIQKMNQKEYIQHGLDTDLILDLMHQFASQEKEKEAKEFAEWLAKNGYRLLTDFIYKDGIRFYGTIDNIYQQFKDKQNDSKAT